MEPLELYRLCISILAVISAAANLTVAVRASRPASKPPHRMLVGYALTAAATNCIGIYFRLTDERDDVHWNVGDFTLLVPTLGFMTMGFLALRWIARENTPHPLTTGRRHDDA